MKIAVIDDKREELEKAKNAIIEAGHEPITIRAGMDNLKNWIERIEQADAVITDLMFASKVKPEQEDIPPAGLLVVIHALSKGKPVVVCTDVFAEDHSLGHHGQAIGWIYDGYVSRLWEGKKNSFGWEENKKWEQAVRQIIFKIEDDDYHREYR